MPYSRFNLLFGQDASNILANKHVLIVGIGGVGSPVVECLVRSGIGHITIVDFDTITISNINRQLMANNKNIGKLKVEVMKERLLAINPQVDVTIYPLVLNDISIDIIFKSYYDFIVDAIDCVDSKVLLIKYGFDHRIPLISSMGLGQRIDPTKVKIMKMNQTSSDPLAKAVRTKLRKQQISLDFVVAASTEEPLKKQDLIGSYIGVTLTGGLLMADYVIKQLLK